MKYKVKDPKDLIVAAGLLMGSLLIFTDIGRLIILVLAFFVMGIFIHRGLEIYDI